MPPVNLGIVGIICTKEDCGGHSTRQNIRGDDGGEEGTEIAAGVARETTDYDVGPPLKGIRQERPPPPRRRGRLLGERVSEQDHTGPWSGDGTADENKSQKRSN